MYLTRPGRRIFCEEVVDQFGHKTVEAGSFLFIFRFCHQVPFLSAQQPLASGLYRPSDIANLPRAFGHSADTRILQLAFRCAKYLK